MQSRQQNSPIDGVSQSKMQGYFTCFITSTEFPISTIMLFAYCLLGSHANSFRPVCWSGDGKSFGTKIRLNACSLAFAWAAVRAHGIPPRAIVVIFSSQITFFFFFVSVPVWLAANKKWCLTTREFQIKLSDALEPCGVSEGGTCPRPTASCNVGRWNYAL